jgi:hypothetical protein
MLRVLYMLARIGLLLHLPDANAVKDLEAEWKARGQDHAEILEDPDVKRNETLLAVKQVMQKLSSAKRELAKLYFFHNHGKEKPAG